MKTETEIRSMAVTIETNLEIAQDVYAEMRTGCFSPALVRDKKMEVDRLATRKDLLSWILD